MEGLRSKPENAEVTAPPLAVGDGPPAGAHNETSNHAAYTTTGDNNASEHLEPACQPMTPPPDLEEVTTGVTVEEITFSEHCKLFRYLNPTNEWKEHGTGILMIVCNPQTNLHRIVMLRDHVRKICANHTIQSAMTLVPMSCSDRAFVWFAHDFSEGEMSYKKFAAKFKTQEMAQSFANAFEEGKHAATKRDEERRETHNRS